MLGGSSRRVAHLGFATGASWASLKNVFDLALKLAATAPYNAALIWFLLLLHC
jgi:hypothetical protein